MLKNFILTFFVLLGIAWPTSSVSAQQVDCSQLDPRASVSKEREGKVQATVNTLFKIARAGGSVEGKMRDEIQNLQKGVPITEQGQVKLRTLYLFCGMVANATDISTERKVDLFKHMMEEKKIDKPKARRTAKKKKQEVQPESKPSAAQPINEQKVPAPQINIQHNPQTNINVASQGQSGGITAQNVTQNITINKFVTWNALDELERGDVNKGEPLVTKIFWLAREPGASISLGPCPGEKCFQFQLGNLIAKEGALIQEIALSGDGFGLKRGPQPSEPHLILHLDSAIRVKGAGLTVPFAANENMFVELRLHPESVFEMFTRKAYIKFTVMDVLVESLRIRLEVMPPKESPMSRAPRP